ncbi:uncharacterized protein I303_104979 [Kwoniella dejecticola CBS 10117]|uniref:Vps72/YL1 C-terminal domain-containing protein n=1 Tax=Kwoniella dejecticola CBS 10117 TaxID=1296121 RepID=A0A1A6A3T5_9TREE|nr:uncharacterized protein I303_05576 [Kwoniella dejecticola CBS 10117]OBR84717.1 hypothetical protein I303_05576 [Kwoniella dejecticola CBS 10117]
MTDHETVTTGRAKRSTAGNRMRELLEKAHQEDDDELFKEVEDDEEFAAPQDVRDVFLDEFADTDEEVEEDEEAQEKALRREERQKAKGKGRAIYDPLSALNKNRLKPQSKSSDPAAKLLSDPSLSSLDPSIDPSSMAPSTLILTLRKQRREAKRENRSEARRSNLRASTLKTEEEIRQREEQEKLSRGKKGRRAQHETGEIRGLRPMTQDELIAAALEEEERNKEALRDWLKKEDEKRELRKISRKRVRGPRLTWVSRTVGRLVEVVGEEEVVKEASKADVSKQGQVEEQPPKGQDGLSEGGILAEKKENGKDSTNAQNQDPPSQGQLSASDQPATISKITRQAESATGAQADTSASPVVTQPTTQAEATSDIADPVINHTLAPTQIAAERKLDAPSVQPTNDQSPMTGQPSAHAEVGSDIAEPANSQTPTTSHTPAQTEANNTSDNLAQAAGIPTGRSDHTKILSASVEPVQVPIDPTHAGDTDADNLSATQAEPSKTADHSTSNPASDETPDQHVSTAEIAITSPHATKTPTAKLASSSHPPQPEETATPIASQNTTRPQPTRTSAAADSQRAKAETATPADQKPEAAVQPNPSANDDSQYTRNYLILSQIPGGLTEEIKLILGDHVEWDKVVYIPGRNRPMNRKKPMCPFTGLPAKYRHPGTMIPYATSEGYKHIEGLLRQRYKYDEGGWWLGGEEDMHAEGMEGVEGWWEATNGGWLAGKRIPEPEPQSEEEIVQEEEKVEEVEEEPLEEVVRGKRKRGKDSQSATPVPAKKRGKGRASTVVIEESEQVSTAAKTKSKGKSKGKSKKK